MKSCIMLTGLLIVFFFILTANNFVGSNIKTDMPEVSRAVKNLPWASGGEFLRAQQEHSAQVLMAAYCVVFENASSNEKHNIRLAAAKIAGTIIEPDEVFSQNEVAGPYDEEHGYKAGQSYAGSEIVTTIGGGVCKIATALYNVSVLSNLEIIERYNHFMPVTYVPLGQDATVVYGSKDLKFKNTALFPLLIWAEGIGNRLYLALYGQEKPPGVKWKHRVLTKIQAPVVYELNPGLAQGEEQTLIEGLEGALVETWVIVTGFDGQTETKYMGISQYWPLPCVIEKNE